MLVYDITNRESFNNIWAWKKDVDEVSYFLILTFPSLHLLIVMRSTFFFLSLVH